MLTLEFFEWNLGTRHLLFATSTLSRNPNMSSSTGEAVRSIPDYKILYFVPNIIGYIRILLLVAAWFYISTSPERFLIFYVVSIILDAFDGITARMLNQTSAFGAWFDVVIDNVGRGFLWCHLFKWGYFVSAFEWIVFVCTHTYGAVWKTTGVDGPPPFWVKAIMANNFKTIIGSYTISGLHILPIWLYALQNWTLLRQLLGSLTTGLITVLLVTGRLTCFAVELFSLDTYQDTFDKLMIHKIKNRTGFVSNSTKW